MRHINYLLLLGVILLGASCGRQADSDKMTLAVSIPPLKYVLEQIVGDKADIVTLLPRGANPENFETTVAAMRDVDRSKAYFHLGMFPFEAKLPGDKSGSDSCKVIEVAVEPSSLIYGTHDHCAGHAHDHHGHAEEGGAPDPHVWSSVSNMRELAKAVTAAMSRIDPDNQSTYQANGERFMQRLDSIDASARHRLASASSKAFVIWHPSLSYFARDYGLEQIPIGQEGKELSVNQLKSQIEAARSHQTKVFFLQREFDARQAEAVSKELGVKTVTIDPLNEDWESEINTVIDALR